MEKNKKKTKKPLKKIPPKTKQIKKTKQVIKKRKLNIKNVVIILIIIATFTIGYNYYTNKLVSSIIITGNNLTKDYEIIEIANLKNYPEIFSLNKGELIEKIKTLPLVNEVAINKSLNGELKITIDEAAPLFYYQSNETYILSNQEQIKGQYLGIPTIINYVPDEKLESLISKFTRIDTAILNVINEVEYSPTKNSEGKVIDDERFILTMNDGNTVHMNTINIEKLNNYFEIYDVLVNQFNDERGLLLLDSNTDAYIFTTYKAMEESEKSDED